MPAFEYQAIDQKGRQCQGVLQADSQRQVRTMMRDKGLLPLRVVAADRHARTRSSWFSPSMKTSELATFTQQLASLIGSGLPLSQSLLAIAEQYHKRRLQTIVMALRASLLEGHSLHTAMAQLPKAFDTQYCATIEAGEQTGQLAFVLARLAEHVQSQEATRRQLQMAAVYPAILTGVALAIVVFLLNSIVPRILGIFISNGQPLPAPTRLLLSVTDFWSQYGLYIGLVVILTGGFFWLWNQHPKRRIWTHIVLLKIPVLGVLLRNVNTTRFAQTVAILIASGVPVLEALKIGGGVVHHLPIRQAILKLTQSVQEGGSLSQSLKETGYFSPMLVHMVASGEMSGQLDDMMQRAAVMQEQQLKAWIDTALKLLEPVLLIMMGFIVLAIVLAVVLPLTQMNAMF